MANKLCTFKSVLSVFCWLMAVAYDELRQINLNAEQLIQLLDQKSLPETGFLNQSVGTKPKLSQKPGFFKLQKYFFKLMLFVICCLVWVIWCGLFGLVFLAIRAPR